MKRKRELQEDRAKLLRRAQHVEARANGAFILGGRAGRYGLNIMGESLPEFGGKQKSRIGRDAIEPLRRVLRAQRLVKRSIDLNGVEVFREIRRFVESFGTPGWIDVTGPIRIRPTRGADANDASGRGSVR